MGLGGLAGVGVVRPRIRASLAAPDPTFTLLDTLPDGSTYDANDILVDGTGFSAGLFTLAYDSDTTVVDGFAEAPGWAIPLAAVLPDYDPLIDILELLLETPSMPAEASKRGICWGLLSVEDHTSAGGAVACIHDNTTTAISGRPLFHLGETLTAGTESLSITTDAALLSIGFTEAGNPQMTSASRDDGAWADALEGPGSAFGGTDPANWHLRIAAYQRSGADATPYTCTGRLYYRVIRRGALPT